VEIVVMLSLKWITFAVPLESTMAYIAAAFATSRGLVVTFVTIANLLVFKQRKPR
jgi:hypothetical protein